MGWWEETLLEKSELKPLIFYRYVDDIIGIWQHGNESFNEFTKIANAIHPRIKIEAFISPLTVNFLDVTITYKNDKLETTIFTKESDKHMYVHERSQHPITTKQAIPIGLAIRAKRICSNEQQYQQNKKKIVHHMKQRGYREEKVRSAMHKVDNMDRENLLQYKTKEDKESTRVPLIITYSSQLPDVQSILHQKMNILHRSAKARKIFPKAPITAFRRDQNLQDILVHIKHSKQFNRTIQGTHQCMKKCTICSYAREGNIVEMNKRYVFNDSITCKTSNLVYGIFCKKCEKLMYVGETGTTVYERMANHISTVRNKKDDPIPRHFNTAGHRVQDLQWMGLERLRNKDIHMRKIRESFWIKKLGTLEPEGLNQNGGIGDQDRGFVVRW